MEQPRLTLLTRPGCHLCDVARDVLARVDITTDPELEAAYGIRIPVVLLDGAEHGYWRVDEARLRRDLGRRGGARADGIPDDRRSPFG